MSLKEQIDNDIKIAMKAREMEKLEALRSVKASILLAETEKGSSGKLTPEQELKILQKLIKQRKEAAQIFTEKNRNDLASTELLQAGYIEFYLPEMLSAEQLKSEIQALIRELGITEVKDFGKVMGAATKKFAGKADNSVISSVIRELLT